MPGGQIVMIIFFAAVLFAGLTSLVNLFEAPIATLQDNLKFSRVKAVVTIAVIGAVASICIQGIVSGWMDFVSIYVCPLGAGPAGIMFAWVWGKRRLRMRCPPAGRTALANGTIRCISMCSAY